MKTSETLTKFAPAFAKAQSEVEGVQLNKENPHFRSRYADLSEVARVVKESLNKNDIGVIQGAGVYMQEKKALCLTTRLLHTSGEFIEETLEIPMDKPTPQGCGSAITYARRYQLGAMMGVVTEEDDDGNAAERDNRRQPAQRKTPARPAAKASAKSTAVSAIVEYSGVEGEDVPAAVRQCCELAGVHLNGDSKLNDDQWNTVTAWVQEQVKNGVSFVDAAAIPLER